MTYFRRLSARNLTPLKRGQLLITRHAAESSHA